MVLPQGCRWDYLDVKVGPKCLDETVGHGGFDGGGGATIVNDQNFGMLHLFYARIFFTQRPVAAMLPRLFALFQTFSKTGRSIAS